MQNLFDISTATPLSYLIVLLVVISIVALFIIIIRRVATQGISYDGGRNRGPRLGVVDTYSLDRNRQLIIVRRDDVEHLLMIGGTNDVLIESNIVRALPVTAIREQQVSFASQNSLASQNDDSSIAQSNYDDRIFAPQISTPVQPQASQPQMPRLKVNPSSIPPQAPTQRAHGESENLRQPDVAQPHAYDAFEPAQPSVPQQAREALSNSELQALAKRLEASIPPLQPKTEKPATQQQVSLAPEPKLAPQPAPMPVAPPQVQQPAPQPVQTPAPPTFSAPQPIIPASPPVVQPMQPPVMPQPRAPMMPQAPQMPKPVMPQAAPQPIQPPMPPQQAQPVAPPAPPEAPPKDKQAAALDENLRRLLGRKLDPR